MKYVLSILFAFSLAACQSSDAPAKTSAQDSMIKKEVNLEGKARAYFASGCFWCVEAIFESVNGVEEVYNGYSGGHTENPTYEASNTGKTGHAEAVEIIYDPSVVSFGTLVDVYLGSQNLEQVNGQGNDIGTQYRSIAFYQSKSEKAIIDEKVFALIQEGYKVATQIEPFEKFWLGEDYHQDYEALHPNHPYIRSVSIPRLNAFKAKFPDILK